MLFITAREYSTYLWAACYNRTMKFPEEESPILLLQVVHISYQ